MGFVYHHIALLVGYMFTETDPHIICNISAVDMSQYLHPRHIGRIAAGSITVNGNNFHAATFSLIKP